MTRLHFAYLVFFVLMAIFFSSPNARAEKRYVFREGSRQAVEVDVNPNQSRQQISPRVYHRRPVARVVPTAATSNNTNIKTGAASAKRSYHYTDTVAVDGLSRKFYVFVPDTYSPASATAVMLVFHGLE
ncbi:MAG TPA: hypothetical protein PKC98_20995 [Candidatus Melainabacteria bacterium]|nr:hypothetical protein [Candidatus Melainabacteria bacterium]